MTGQRRGGNEDMIVPRVAVVPTRRVFVGVDDALVPRVSGCGE
jgi:hypothetical protein